MPLTKLSSDARQSPAGTVRDRAVDVAWLTARAVVIFGH